MDAALRHDVVETPQGPVSFATDGKRVRGVTLGRGKRSAGPATALDREVKRQLGEYFRGRRDAFDLPVALEAPRFTAEVLAAVEDIPYGETRSYGEIALLVGRPNAARAVGQAVGANPLPLLIPCHRVLAAHRRLGGFGGGTAWKRFLLGLEGADWRE